MTDNDLKDVEIIDSSFEPSDAKYIKDCILSQIFYKENHNLKISADHRLILMNNQCNLKKFITTKVNTYLIDVDCTLYKLDSYSDERKKYLEKISLVDIDYYIINHIVLKESPTSYFYVNIICKLNNDLTKVENILIENNNNNKDDIITINKLLKQNDESINLLENKISNNEQLFNNDIQKLNDLLKENKSTIEKHEDIMSNLKNLIKNFDDKYSSILNNHQHKLDALNMMVFPNGVGLQRY